MRVRDFDDVVVAVPDRDVDRVRVCDTVPVRDFDVAQGSVGACDGEGDGRGDCDPIGVAVATNDAEAPVVGAGDG